MRRNVPLSGRSGFTLIEILVVVAIISILAGLSMYGVTRARKTGQESAVRADIQNLCVRIESFKVAVGYYPPSSISSLPLAGTAAKGAIVTGKVAPKTNGINDGNECLFLCLLSRKKGGPFADDLPEDRWANADADTLTPVDQKTIVANLDPARGTDQLLEHVDLWGSPFVYIHSRDYGKKLKCQAPGGEPFEVEARKNPTTGTYCAPTTFQLWSLGVDGINQNGEGDDIVSWK